MLDLIIYHIKRSPQDFILANFLIWTCAFMATAF